MLTSFQSLVRKTIKKNLQVKLTTGFGSLTDMIWATNSGTNSWLSYPTTTTRTATKTRNTTHSKFNKFTKGTAQLRPSNKKSLSSSTTTTRSPTLISETEFFSLTLNSKPSKLIQSYSLKNWGLKPFWEEWRWWKPDSTMPSRFWSWMRMQSSTALDTRPRSCFPTRTYKGTWDTW